MYNYYRSHRNLAEEVLRVHYSDLLVDITHPYSLVSGLLPKKVIAHSIGSAMLADNLTRREKMVILVDAIIAAISDQPAYFHTLIKVLEEKPPHDSVAKLLCQSHGNSEIQ